MEKPQYLQLEEQYPYDWAFNRPVQWEFFDRKLDRVESLRDEGQTEKAIAACLEIINACPEYLPALNMLGLLYRQQGDLDAAIQMFQMGVTIGVACLPAKFNAGVDLIPWHWEDNRAFLLACEHLGASHLESALNMFEYTLKVNPGYHSIDALVLKLRAACKSIGIE